MTVVTRLALLLASIAISSSALAQRAAPDPALAKRCPSLAAPAGTVLAQPPSWHSSEPLPAHCRVRGQIQGRTHFELRLPESWNGRFVMAGCGGFCGSLLPDKPGFSNSINEALKKGYAAISHDGGHSGQSWETQWAYNDAEALELYAHKVLPVVTDVGVALTTAFYGKAPHHRYFSGCSNGGRLGMIAAQRYPELFDGIAAGGSIFSLSEIAGKWGNWMTRQTTHHGKPVIPRRNNDLLKEAVMAQCDGIDGQRDGIISAPQQCRPSFAALACKSGDASERCFTKSAIARLERLYSGQPVPGAPPVTQTLAPGAEHYTDIWLFGDDENAAWGLAASTGYRNLLSQELFQRDHKAPLDHNTLAAWLDKSALPALLDADNPDLSALGRAGGKLFLYHGWADPLIIPGPIVDYYRAAAAHSGGVDTLKNHARLFMLPGWGHCWERAADAPDQFDPLEIVANWVETGVAPAQFTASQHDDQQHVVRTRPICAYPNVATLSKPDSPDHAASYTCSPP